MIETSGLADPVPLIRTLVTDDRIRRLYVLDTVLCMLDAVNCLNHLETMHEARKQLVVSDVQMLSKLDLVAREVVADIERAVAAMTKGTSVHLLPHEEPDPSFLFRGANSGKAGACIVHASPPGFRSIASAAASGAHHTAEISSFSTVCDGRTSASELATWLSMLASLRGQALLRVKGIVNVGGRPYAIDVVQNVIHEPTPLERWPDSDERTRLVIIAKGLNRHATERLVSSLSMVDSFSDATKIDPAAYHRFRETAEYILRG